MSSTSSSRKDRFASRSSSSFPSSDLQLRRRTGDLGRGNPALSPLFEDTAGGLFQCTSETASAVARLATLRRRRRRRASSRLIGHIRDERTGRPARTRSRAGRPRSRRRAPPIPVSLEHGWLATQAAADRLHRRRPARRDPDPAAWNPVPRAHRRTWPERMLGSEGIRCDAADGDSDVVVHRLGSLDRVVGAASGGDGGGVGGSRWGDPRCGGCPRRPGVRHGR